MATQAAVNFALWISTDASLMVQVTPICHLQGKMWCDVGNSHRIFLTAKEGGIFMRLNYIHTNCVIELGRYFIYILQYSLAWYDIDTICSVIIMAGQGSCMFLLWLLSSAGDLISEKRSCLKSKIAMSESLEVCQFSSTEAISTYCYNVSASNWVQRFLRRLGIFAFTNFVKNVCLSQECTVIRFFFVVQIFSYTENVRKFFMRI